MSMILFTACVHIKNRVNDEFFAWCNNFSNFLVDANFYQNSKKQGMKRPMMVVLDKKTAEFAT